MNRYGISTDRHSLVRNSYPGGGQLMDTRRTCSRCLRKMPQKGGTTKGGFGFRCVDCKTKGEK